MASRQTRGRQRIEIRRIEKQDDLYATFSKRRLGLYKKASELGTLCGADIGIIVFSPTNNPFSFFHPSMESVLERYRNPDQPLSDSTRVVEAHARARIAHLNERLDDVSAEKEKIKEREKELDEILKTRPKGWWEEPIENLNKEQVREWIAFFEDFKFRIKNRIEELNNGGPPSGSPNVPDATGEDVGVGPSVFAHNHVPRTTMGAFGDEQFTSQYQVPPLTHDPSGDGAGPSYHYLPPPPVDQDASTAGGAGPSHCYLPPPDQEPSGGAGPSGYYLPSSDDQDPFGESFAHFPSYLPPWGQDPSTGGGTDEAGPSNQTNIDP